MNKKRILVVDDEVSFTRLLKLNLEQTNDYEVQVENWPEEALATARAFRPDLVLLDVLMPRMFGGDVAAGFRADAGLKATPIVFFTAAVSKTRVKEHAGFIGDFPFLAKPVSVEEVVDQIEQRLAGGPCIRDRLPSGENRIIDTAICGRNGSREMDLCHASTTR